MTVEHRREWRRPGITTRSDFERGFASRPGRGHSVTFWALVAFTFLFLVGPQSFVPDLVSLHLARAVIVLALVSYVVDRFTSGKSFTIVTFEMRVAACLAAWAVLTVPFSLWPRGSAEFLLDRYFKVLALFWLLSNVVDSLARLRRLSWAIALLSLAPAAIAVRDYLSGAFARIPGYAGGVTDGIATGTHMANPNDLALTLNLFLPLSVALLLTEKSPRSRILLMMIVVLNIAGVIVTFSRAGALTLGVIALLFFWKLVRRPERRWAYGIAVLTVAALPFLPDGYLSRLATIGDIESDPTNSSQQRWADMGAALRYVARNPVIGAGIGSDQLALNEERGAVWLQVHNVYLQHAVDLGLPGLTLFLAILIGCLKRLKTVRIRAGGWRGSSDLFYLVSGLQISLLSFAVSGFFHPAAYQVYFYYIAGLVVGVTATSETRHAVRA